jgi:hypothetical protein
LLHLIKSEQQVHFTKKQTQLFLLPSSAVSEIMNNKFFTGVLVAAAAVVGSLTQASVASANISATSSVWSSSQPTIFSGASKGVNHNDYQSYVQQERVKLTGSDQLELDASKLFLKHDHDVNVFFINEGAATVNQLAYGATGKTNQTGLLFGDVACNHRERPCITQGRSGALALGSGVNVGPVKGGTLLDFYLKKTTSSGVNHVFGTQGNPDNLPHVVAYALDKRYILVGIENQYGALGATGRDANGIMNERSDRDFNDVVFIVDVGEANMTCLTRNVNDQDACKKTPEPAAAIGLLGMGATALMMRRRRG